MTYAPGKLLELREYLKPRTGLGNLALGITSDGYGDSYHRGRGYIGDGSYSVHESRRDEAGLSGASSALDIGGFDRTTDGRRHTLRSLTLWLVEQCRAGAADTRDIREIIYTPDGRVVRRWDRLGVRSSGDDSHLTHTHISWFRDSEYRDKIAVFRRYFEGDDMAGAEDVLREVAGLRTMLQAHHLQNQGDRVRDGSMAGVLYGVKQTRAELGAILAAVNGESADEIQARVRAELERAAENERTERQAEYAALGEQLAAAIGEKLGPEYGQVVAAEFVKILQRGVTEPTA